MNVLPLIHTLAHSHKYTHTQEEQCINEQAFHPAAHSDHVFFSECLCRQKLNMAVVLGKGLWQRADKTLEVLGSSLSSNSSFGLSSEWFPRNLTVASQGVGEVVGFHPGVLCSHWWGAAGTWLHLRPGADICKTC